MNKQNKTKKKHTNLNFITNFDKHSIYLNIKTVFTITHFLTAFLEIRNDIIQTKLQTFKIRKDMSKILQ